MFAKGKRMRGNRRRITRGERRQIGSSRGSW